MVKHLVMWRLCDKERARQGLDGEPLIKQAVAAMRAGIAGLNLLEIGYNKCAESDSSDLVLYSEFDSWEALRAYENHPLHEVLKGLIRPMRTERRVVDYEVS
jgi:Stress responsive A/B Barrel Domain